MPKESAIACEWKVILELFTNVEVQQLHELFFVTFIQRLKRMQDGTVYVCMTGTSSFNV